MLSFGDDVLNFTKFLQKYLYTIIVPLSMCSIPRFFDNIKCHKMFKFLYTSQFYILRALIFFKIVLK